MEARHRHLVWYGQYKTGERLLSALILGNGVWLTLNYLITGTQLKDCREAAADFADLPDEVIGLPAGFLQAGVPGVVGTLWPVNDLSTMLLMVRFYRYHLRGDKKTGAGPMAPAVALRRAQLWLRDATCEELAEVFDQFRVEARGETRMTYELAQEQFTRYSTRGASDERPFAHPCYWAPFVFYGC